MSISNLGGTLGHGETLIKDWYTNVANQIIRGLERIGLVAKIIPFLEINNRIDLVTRLFAVMMQTIWYNSRATLWLGP